MTEGTSAPAGENEPWHFLETLIGSVGFYLALAAVIVVIWAWKSPQILQQLRRWSEWIILCRQTRSTTADTLANRSEKLTQRIRAVRAIEEAPAETEDKEDLP